MHARWLDPTALAPADLDAWRDLAARAAEPNAFFDPAFLVPALRHLPRERVRLLAVADGRDWVAALPVQPQLRRRRLPLPARATWRHLYGYLGTPLLAEGLERPAALTLVDALRARTGLVTLDLVRSDGPVVAALDAALAEHDLASVVTELRDRAALVRRPANDYVETTLKIKRRRELKRLRKQLTEVLGAEPVTVDRAGDPEAVDRFLQLEASGWKGRAGTALATARDGDFFRGICAAFAAEGRLQLLAYGTPERTVAMKCNLLAQDGVFCLKIAHDEELAKYSPGVQLEVENVDVFHGRPELAWMDSCADPDNQMINRLWPDRRSLVSRTYARGGLVGLAVRGEEELVASVRRLRKERHA